MENSLAEILKTKHSARLAAKSSIDSEVFKCIPFFDEVFEKDVWPLLVKLSGSDGIAHIELKEKKPGDTIIKKGEFDMMVFWLLKGCADVIVEINRKPTIINQYDESGHCFGELAIIEGCERTADVFASKKKGATIIEVDWSITGICPELEAKFNLLLLKTINQKLMGSYDTFNKAYRALQILKRESEKQAGAAKKLQSLLEKNNIPFKEGDAEGIIDKIESVAKDLDRSIEK